MYCARQGTPHLQDPEVPCKPTHSVYRDVAATIITKRELGECKERARFSRPQIRLAVALLDNDERNPSSGQIATDFGIACSPERLNPSTLISIQMYLLFEQCRISGTRRMNRLLWLPGESPIERASKRIRDLHCTYLYLLLGPWSHPGISLSRCDWKYTTYRGHTIVNKAQSSVHVGGGVARPQPNHNHNKLWQLAIPS